MTQIRNVDGLVMGQTGANPLVMGTRMVTNAKGTPGYQYRFTIAASNPLIYIFTRYYRSLSQNNAPSQDFCPTEVISLAAYFDTSGNGSQISAQEWRDGSYVGYGNTFSTRQADVYFWDTTNSFPAALSTTALIWCNRWDDEKESLLKNNSFQDLF